MKKENKKRLLAKHLMKTVLFSFIVAMYIFFSMLVNLTNSDFKKYDQIKYINAVKKTYADNFWYMGDRIRTPGYQYIQSLFLSPELSERQMFERGKYINIVFSFLILWFVFWIARRFFSEFASFVFTLIITFGLVVHGSAYFRVEIIYYFLLFLAFISLFKTLSGESVKMFAVSGVLMAISYLFKASALLTFYIFIIVGAFQIVYTSILALVKKADKKRIIKRLKKLVIGLCLFIVTFLGITSFYLIDNKSLYNKYFFNIGTSYFMWFDNRSSYYEIDNQILQNSTTGGHLDELDLPNFASYMDKHTISDILRRFYTGIRKLVDMMLDRNYYVSIAISLFLYYFFAIGVVTLVAMVKRKVKINLFKDKYIFLFSFFVINFLAIAWYSNLELTDRFIMALYLPAMFCLFYLMSLLKKYMPVSISVGSRIYNNYNLFHILAICLLFQLTIFYFV